MAYITLTFDDGTLDHIATAYPLLKRYNVKATAYIIAGLIGKSFEGRRLMNAEQIKHLQDSGWEIGSHSLTHPFLIGLGDTEVVNELKSSKEILESHGLRVKSFSVPYGAYDARIRGHVREYYSSARTSIQGYNPTEGMDPYTLKAQVILNSTTLEEMKDWVDYVKYTNLWLIMMIHRVRKDSSDLYSVNPSTLEKLIRHILSQNIEIKTVSELI